MSIKTIDQASMDDGVGIAKKIDAGAEKLMYDVLQATQYSTPIASTVRELATNAWDSQREKEIAIEILTDVKKVEDYYIHRDGAQYLDSNFDPSYYDLSHLNTEKSQVELRYTKHEGAGFCDTFEVIDYGVGLGGRRLEGILSLGFSSKRNTSEGFGAFGLGAKVALSTNVPFYTIDTIYNGMRFVCNCYPYKTKFVTGKFNLETEKANPFVTFSTGDIVYYEPTTELNRTIVSFGVKKHNRAAFKEAVQEQLVYIDGINFVEVDEESGYGSEGHAVGTKAQILYNSESLILSEGTVFNKPHIVIVKSPQDPAGINYGFVDFKELEMQQMYGSIGFKCPIRQSYRDETTGEEHILQEGVTVTPSREKVIWNDATKKYIHNVIERATGEAEVLVEKDLSDATEFFDWIRKCRAIFSKMDNTSVLGRLSNIIDIQKLSPKFPTNRNIKYGSFNSMFPGVIVERVSVDYRGKAKREVVDRWDQITKIDKDSMYIKDSKYSPAKDLYLCKTLGLQDFLTFQPALMSEEEKVKLRMKNPETAAELILKHENRCKVVWKLVEESDDMLMYSEIEVPDHIKEAVEQAAEKEVLDTLSPSEMRKMEGKEVGYTLRFDPNRYDEGEGVYGSWIMDKVEPRKKDLLFTDQPTYYTRGVEKPDLIEAAKLLSGPSPDVGKIYNQTWLSFQKKEPSLFRLSPSLNYTNHSKTNFFPEKGNDTPQLIQLNESIIKSIPSDSDLRPLVELYNRREEKTVMTMHQSIINAFTAWKLGSMWDKFDYMQHFKGIDNIIYQKYMDLKKFMDVYFVDKQSLDMFALDGSGSILQHAESLYRMQMFCMAEKTEEEIAQKSFELFLFTDVTDAKAVDMNIIHLYQELCDYNEGVGDLLNLLHKDCFLSDEGSGEIQKYLKARDRRNWQWESE